jgi:hypothetical protein
MKFSDWLIFQGDPDKNLSDNMDNYLDYEYNCDIKRYEIKKASEIEYRIPTKKYHFISKINKEK